MQILTKRGYDLFEVASSLQKSIRRNDVKIAGYFGLELFASGFSNYAWKRLLTVSAEDCYGSTITTEIKNLYDSFVIINGGKIGKNSIKGRIFISKAILILCRTLKNRDPDLLQNCIYDKKILISDNEINNFINGLSESEKIPEYAYDVHTMKGKRSGKTKNDFFVEEFNEMKPVQKGLFDGLHNDIQKGKIKF